jgi:hypothetical protein
MFELSLLDRVKKKTVEEIFFLSDQITLLIDLLIIQYIILFCDINKTKSDCRI